VEPIDDDRSPWDLVFDRPHEPFIPICARALDGVPKLRGDRVQVSFKPQLASSDRISW
jgi:hypothetical protein